MPTIDEINQASFFNRQLDLYNLAIDICKRGGGAIMSMTLASNAEPPQGTPQQNGLVALNMMPPIEDQNVLNILADAFQQAADVITQHLIDLGFSPSTPEGARKANEVPYAWLRQPNMLTDPRRPRGGLNLAESRIPPHFSIYPYQMAAPGAESPPQPVPPQYPVNPPDPPPPPSDTPPAPPTLTEGQPPSEFPEGSPAVEPPPNPNQTP